MQEVEKNKLKKIGSQVFYVTIVIVVFIVIPFLWGSFLISGGDYFHIFFPSEQISQWLYTWDYQNLLGLPSANNSCAIFPFLLFLSIFEFLGFTPELIERFWFIFILLLQFFSMYYLLTSLDIRSKNAKLISSMFYAINPVSTLFLMTPPIALGIALMALILGLLIRGMKTKSIIYFIAIINISFICSYIAVNTAVFVAVWIPTIFYIVINFSKIKKIHLLTLFFGVLIANVYWIFNILINIVGGDVVLERSISWVTWTSSNSSILNMLRFQGFWAWNTESFGSLTFPYKVFYDHPAMMFIGFCIIIIAFSVYINVRKFSREKKRNIHIFAVLFLLSLLIAKGMHEPLSSLNQFAYENIPLFWMFRSPWSKVMPVVIFSFIILFCYSIDYFEKRILLIHNAKIKAFSIKTASLVLLLLIFSFSIPYFTGDIFSGDRGNYPGVRIKVPDYWFEASDFINNKLASGRVLLLPPNPFYQMHYFWPGDGYYGIDPTSYLIFKPLVLRSPGGGFLGNSTSGFLESLYYKMAHGTKDELIDYFKKANIKYILHRNDLDWTHIGEKNSDIFLEQEIVEKRIKDIPLKLIKSFGTIDTENNSSDQYFTQNIVKRYHYMDGRQALDLYELDEKYFKPKIVASTTYTDEKSSSENVIGREIIFKKINPTKYLVRVSQAQEPFQLIFSESFHKQWKLYQLPVTNKILLEFDEVVSDYPETRVKEIKYLMNFAPQDIAFLFKEPLRSRHQVVNGYANGWHIEAEELSSGEDLFFVIYFLPQSFFYLGLMMSGTIFVGCTVYLVYYGFRRKKRRGLRNNFSNKLKN